MVLGALVNAPLSRVVDPRLARRLGLAAAEVLAVLWLRCGVPDDAGIDVVDEGVQVVAVLQHCKIRT